MVMPFLVKALLDNRARYQESGRTEGEDALFAREPKARGYLRPREGYRLFEQRARLNAAAYRRRAQQSGLAAGEPWRTRSRQKP